MQKIAILGVESSGKTVLLSGLGGRYAKADANGMFLVPESRETMSYVNSQLATLRRGEWPAATTPDSMQKLEWSLRRCPAGGVPVRVGDLTVLDFAGEVYRAAFEGGAQDGIENEVKALKDYVGEASSLVVLINQSDLITYGEMDDKVQGMVWATKKILDFVVEKLGASAGCDLKHRVALVFTQTDRYEATIRSYANIVEMFETLLPMISQSYDGLDILCARVVDKTSLDDDGMEIPDAKLSETGMAELWDWLVSRCESAISAKDLVERLLAAVKSDNLFGQGSIPAGKLANARRSMKILEPEDEVFLLLDGTIFGSAEEGLVITSKAFYGKDLGEDPWRVPIDLDWTAAKTGFINDYIALTCNGSKNEVMSYGLDGAKTAIFVRTLNEWKQS